MSQKLANITFRRVAAVGNADDAFDLHTHVDSAVNISFEDCVARDCSGGWGSGWVISQLRERGMISLRNCRAVRMPGAAIAVGVRQPPNVSLAQTALSVRGFVAENCSRFWDGGVGSQGFFPITLSSTPLPNHIDMTDVVVRRQGAEPAGQSFIGCQNSSWFVKPCDATKVPGLQGRVAVFGGDRRYCRSPVGNKLAVTCHVMSKTDDAEIEQFTIVVFGATPAGIAAAVAARRTSPSLRVALVEPSRWIGGMMAGGLGCT